MEYEAPGGPYEAPGGPYEFWKPKPPYDIIVARDAQNTEVFKLTYEGDIYWRGRKIESDDDVRKATAEFIKLWSGSHNQYNQYIEEQSKYPK